MRFWRLTKAKHAASALSGFGSTLRGGRWHERGMPVVYVASSGALALLETLVYADPADLAAIAYVSLAADVPDGLVEHLDRGALPADWQAWPHPASTKRIGRAWYEAQRSVALVVPSAVVPHEANALLNPRHPEFGRVGVGAAEAFPIDARLAL